VVELQDRAIRDDRRRKTTCCYVASSQQRPKAYLFAQVETNQPEVLGISSGLL